MMTAEQFNFVKLLAGLIHIADRFIQGPLRTYQECPELRALTWYATYTWEELP